MSASERLKALAPRELADGHLLWDALPQIVAVVEAAEEVAPFLPPARQWLREALAALDEALTPATDQGIPGTGQVGC